MLIIVKIGTNSVIGNIAKIASDVNNLKNNGIDVILISSGAVGMGRTSSPDLKSSSIEKQILASIGQVRLMNEYAIEFLKYNIITSQILITKKDIEGRVESENIENLINGTLKIKNIIPIINENDSVSIRELMFTDNDEIAGIIAGKFAANRLIILTNVDGIYDDYKSPDRNIVRFVDDISTLKISNDTSSMGRGGMQSKIATCSKLSHLGISSTIANVNIDNVLHRIIKGEEIGTEFRPKRSTPARKAKRTIAFESGLSAKGKITMNEFFTNISNKTISILPIGVERYQGEFCKGDLIEIYNHENEKIGYGISNISHKELSETIGMKNKKPVVRYENMYIVSYE